MASDDSMTIRSCISMQEDEYYEDTDDWFDQLPHPHNLSRLSMCSVCGTDREDVMDYDSNHHDHGNYYYHGQDKSPEDTTAGTNMFMSHLSMESFDRDVLEVGLSSDSDKEPSSYSLPATPPRRRAPGGMSHYKHPNSMLLKEYASENEAQTVMGNISRKSRRRTRRTRIINNRHSWLSASPDRGNIAKKKDDDDDDDDTKDARNTMMARTDTSQLGHCHSFSGESEGGSVVVITRPKGGRRSLCMDMEEVKACRDLGFELEHQHMLHEMPQYHLSRSASTLDTNTTCSSGGNSPIANWRISSPGDDPREVKARIKVWAQAVALASTSRQGI
ncbi:hypothetical protein ACFX1W_029546 [Malus domestica]